MPAGIQVINNSGSVLIDETYRNLAVSSASSGGLLAVGQSRTLRFDVPSPGGVNFGLQIFNAAGQCTFDSNLKYARVIDTVAGPAFGASLVKNYTAGREYAVVTSKRGVDVVHETRPDPDSPPGWFNYRQVFRGCRPTITGNSITFAWQTIGEGAWSPPIQTVPAPATPDHQSRFVVLDITGY